MRLLHHLSFALAPLTLSLFPAVFVCLCIECFLFVHRFGLFVQVHEWKKNNPLSLIKQERKKKERNPLVSYQFPAKHFHFNSDTNTHTQIDAIVAKFAMYPKIHHKDSLEIKILLVFSGFFRFSSERERFIAIVSCSIGLDCMRSSRSTSSSSSSVVAGENARINVFIRCRPPPPQVLISP